MDNISYKLENNHNISYLYCYGNWSVFTIENVEKDLYTLKIASKKLIINLDNIDKLDSSGALILALLKDRLKKDIEVEYSSKNKNYLKLLAIVEENLNLKKVSIKPVNRALEKFLKNIKNLYSYILDLIAFVGELFIKTLQIFKNIKNFRLLETIYFIQTSGINAIPIIAMTAFLVGVVIAYQTIVQLNKFGADIFVVDASAIAIARELGPMITAIVVAGRSASSYTAEIGAMKLTQEIDAMKTMGFVPYYFLVIPRVVALIIAMPLLIFFSDMIGIFGAMVITKAHIGFSFEIFINRMYEVLKLKHFLVGIIKGPFFAIAIAIIGSFHGFRVEQNSESIGIETTKSVVNAIFLVIVIDALFSIIFTKLGI